MDPLAFGAAFAAASAVIFAAVHAQQQLAHRQRAGQRLQELERPYASGAEMPATLPWRRAPSGIPVLALFFARGSRGEDMDDMLAHAGLEIRPGAFLLIQALGAALGAVVGLLIGGTAAVGLLLAVPLALFGWVLPRIYLAVKTARRLEQMDVQLVDLLGLLSSSIRAGFSLLQGLDSASSRVGPPIQVEVERVLADVRLGQRMEDALRAWSDRVPSASVRLLVTAMMVQRSAGGNLAEVLDNLAQTMRERVELKHQVNALTAYSRLSARVVGLYPFAIAVLLTVMNPSIYTRLWTTPIGWSVIGVALGLNTMAFLIMRKVARVEF